MENNYLTNEISQLERFIAEKHNYGNGISEAEYLQNLKLISQENERIKEAIWNTIFNLGLDQARISSFIDYHLNKIIDLSETFYSIRQEITEKTTIKVDSEQGFNIYDLLLDQLNELIDYLKAKFSPHFSPLLKPPLAYIDAVKRHCNTESVYILSKMKKENLNADMVGVLQNYFNDPLGVNGGNELIKKDGFHRLEYFQTLISSIFSICNDKGLKNLETQVQIELISLNFNLLDYVWFSIKKLKPEYNKVMDIDHEINLLNFTKNEITHLPEKHNYGYETDAPSLKNLLVKMLKEEIKFLTKLDEREREYKPLKETSTNGSFYFEVNFTLKELLFLFRLLIETSYLIIKNRTGIFNFISKHIQTKKHSQLSVGSMKRKFNHRDQKSIKNVRSALLDMIRLINEKYLLVTIFYYIAGESFYFPQI